MKPSFAVVAILALVVPPLPCAAQEEKPFLDPAAEAQALRLVDAWLEVQRDLDRIPAMSVGVVRGQKLVWAKGYGTIDARGQVPATPKTLYSVCSITKLFTSVALMRLYDAQKLRLDDDILTLLPEHKFVQSDPDSAAITIRAAMTHSSGLPREADFPYWSGPDFAFPSSEQVKARLAQQKTLYRTGDRYQYSNLGMSLLGEMVARVSGQPYSSYVQANILDPLGMSETRFGLPMERYGRQLAVGYGSRKRDGTRDVVNPFKIEGMNPAAGLTTNVEDLARFVSWQFRLLKNGGTEILRASTLREMQRVQWTDRDGKTTWGLGFAVRYEAGKSVVGHGGSCPGYRTGVRMLPDQELGIIVLTNTMETTAKYLNNIAKILARAKKIEKPKEGQATVSLEDYAGRYNAQPWATEFAVVPWGANLAALAFPFEDIDNELDVLKPTGKDAFRKVRDDDTLGTETRFERDGQGKVTRVVTNSQFSVRLDPK
jgi:YD repeat-containing protein